MVVRRREKKEEDGCHYCEKQKGCKKRGACGKIRAPTDRKGYPLRKRCSNTPTNGQVLQRMAREHLGKKAGIR
jgi:hypothetical protein